MTSAMEDKASWPFDENHGNEATAVRSATATTPSQITAMTLDALNSLEGDGSIAELSVDTRRSTVNATGGARVDVSIGWSSPGGRQTQRTTL